MPRALLLTLFAGCLLVAPARGAEANPLYRALTQDDRALAADTVQAALESLPSQQTRGWQNPATGASGFVTPIRTFKIESGHFCREYQEAIVTRSRAEALQFTACRRASDGIWLPVGG